MPLSRPTIPFSRQVAQQIIRDLQDGSTEKVISALTTCEAVIPSDVNAFCTNILASVIQVGQNTDAGVRSHMTSLIEVLYHHLDQVLDQSKFVVLASCLEALVLFLSDENISLKKKVMLTFGRTFQHIFTVFCLYPGDPRYWSLLEILKGQIDTYLVHPNEGLKLCAISCIQQLILVQSYRDPTLIGEQLGTALDICPATHPFINKQQVEAEAITNLNKFITILSQSAQARMTSGFIMAVMNAVFEIIKNRPQFALHCTSALLDIFKNPPTYLSSTQMRSIEKTLRAIMLLIVSIPSVASLGPMIEDVLIRLGMRPFEIQARFRRDQKRQLEDEQLEQEAKRFRSELEAEDGTEKVDLSNLILQNGKVEDIPLSLIADVVVETLLNRPQDLWNQDVSKYRSEIFPPPAPPNAGGSSRDPRRRGAEIDQAQAVRAAQLYQQQVTEYQQKLVFAKSEVGNFFEILKQTYADIFADINPVLDVQGEEGDEEEDDQVADESAVVPSASEVKPEVDEDVMKEILEDCFERILDTGTFFAVRNLPGGKAPPFVTKAQDTVIAARLGWSSIIVRLASIQSQNSTLIQDVACRYFLSDFRKRIDLAVFWLYEVYRQCKQSSSLDRYDVTFQKLLDYMKGVNSGVDPDSEIHEEWARGLDPRDRLFTKFLVEVPRLPGCGIERVLEYCNEPSRMLLGMATLRDLVTYRPALRDQCLNHLLRFCIHQESSIRYAAIGTVKLFYPRHPVLASVIEEKATEGLSYFAEKFSIHSESGEPEPEADGQTDEETTSQYLVYLELYLALIARKHDLVKRIFDVYTRVSLNAQILIQQATAPLFFQMASEPAELFKMVHEFPLYSEELMLVALDQILEKSGSTIPSPDFLTEVNNACTERNLDKRFIKYVIAEVEKEQIFGYLPRVIQGIYETSDEQELVKEIFASLLQGQVTEEAATGEVIVTKKAALAPEELLVHLHAIDLTVHSEKDVETAIDLCLDMKDVYKSEVLAVVLQQLEDRPTLPQLFMSTALKTLTAYKSLASFTNKILLNLVRRRIWTDEKQWSEYIRLCTIGFPGSLSVLLSLPREHGVDLLKRSPDLQSSLQQYYEEIPVSQRGRREVVMLQVLLSESFM